MSTTETTSTGGDAPSTTEKVQYQPHRAWYRRVDVLVPIALIALGYLFLIVAVEEKSFFRTRLTADGNENFDWMYFWHLCLLYTSPSPRDLSTSRMPSSA